MALTQVVIRLFNLVKGYATNLSKKLWCELNTSLLTAVSVYTKIRIISIFKIDFQVMSWKKVIFPTLTRFNSLFDLVVEF